MSALLSYTELCALVDTGVIEGVDKDCINSASIDIRLGNKILVEAERGGKVSLANKERLNTIEVDLTEVGHWILEPGEFILAQSMEIFHLPNFISAEYKLKSSMARIGLEHLNAGWCDAGWHGSVLTLELKNMTQYHDIVIRPGDRIGQIVFFKHDPVPEDKSYAVRGRYNGDKEVSGTKPDPVQYRIPF